MFGIFNLFIRWYICIFANIFVPLYIERRKPSNELNHKIKENEEDSLRIFQVSVNC